MLKEARGRIAHGLSELILRRQGETAETYKVFTAALEAGDETTEAKRQAADAQYTHLQEVQGLPEKILPLFDTMLQILEGVKEADLPITESEVISTEPTDKENETIELVNLSGAEFCSAFWWFRLFPDRLGKQVTADEAAQTYFDGKRTATSLYQGLAKAQEKIGQALQYLRTTSREKDEPTFPLNLTETQRAKLENFPHLAEILTLIGTVQDYKKMTLAEIIDFIKRTTSKKGRPKKNATENGDNPVDTPESTDPNTLTDLEISDMAIAAIISGAASAPKDQRLLHESFDPLFTSYQTLSQDQKAAIRRSVIAKLQTFLSMPKDEQRVFIQNQNDAMKLILTVIKKEVNSPEQLVAFLEGGK